MNIKPTGKTGGDSVQVLARFDASEYGEQICKVANTFS